MVSYVTECTNSKHYLLVVSLVSGFHLCNPEDVGRYPQTLKTRVLVAKGGAKPGLEVAVVVNDAVITGSDSSHLTEGPCELGDREV